MSNAVFVEALSSDPYVRELHRRVVRVLNDPSLDRQQREFHVRQVQSLLLAHQARQVVKAKKLADKQAQLTQGSRHNSNQGVAHPSQVVARNRELGNAAKKATPAEIKAQPAVTPVAANDTHMHGHKTYRNRSLIKLKKV